MATIVLLVHSITQLQVDTHADALEFLLIEERRDKVRRSRHGRENGYGHLRCRCYRVIVGKDQQVNWDRARQRCQESQSDLLVFRSAEEVIQRLPINDSIISI